MGETKCGHCDKTIYLENCWISPGRGNVKAEWRLMPIMSNYYLQDLSKYYCGAKCSSDDYEPMISGEGVGISTERTIDGHDPVIEGYGEG